MAQLTAPVSMERYPYLAQYKNTSQFKDVVIMMLEPQAGRVLYIPPNLSTTDPRNELSLLEAMNPAHSEIEPYTGSVILRTSADPELDD